MNNERILSGILIIAIVIAVATIIYVNLDNTTSNETSDQNMDINNGTSNNDKIILNVSFGDMNINYTLDQLVSLESYNGSGRYIKTKLLPDTIIISETHQYTGVRITTLLDQFGSIPENCTIVIHASDGWSMNYTWDQIHGDIQVYNETAQIIDNATATMIIAYSEDGEYYIDKNPDTIGPLRIAFIDGNPITSSNLWVKKVSSIEIIT